MKQKARPEKVLHHLNTIETTQTYPNTPACLEKTKCNFERTRKLCNIHQFNSKNKQTNKQTSKQKQKQKQKTQLRVKNTHVKMGPSPLR